MIATLDFPGLRVRAKPRPRTGKGFIYMPKTYIAWLERVRFEAMPQLREQGWQTIMSGPVSLELWIVQKAWRCDVDAALGAFMDALQGPGGAYLDDSQVICPMVRPEIGSKDNARIVLEVPTGLDKGMIEWVRQGQARQEGARKGRNMQAIQGRRKF